MAKKLEQLYEGKAKKVFKTDDPDTPQHELILLEREEPNTFDEVEEKLSILKKAIEANNNEAAKEALRLVVPTFKSPEEVNSDAHNSMEMNIIKKM